MLYAKINLEGDVEEYPLVADQIRSRHLETSLPFVLDEASLPFGYVVVKTSDSQDIDSKHISKLENMIPVKDINKTYYTIDITDAELNDKDAEDGSLTPLGQKKLEKYIQLSAYIDTVVDQVMNFHKIPKAEMSTWTKQFDEALAWSTDPFAKTPILDIIGKTRGVDLVLLKQKALQKALTYQTVLSYIVGRKQALEDQIDRAESESEVDSIKFQITLEEIQTATNHYNR